MVQKYCPHREIFWVQTCSFYVVQDFRFFIKISINSEFSVLFQKINSEFSVLFQKISSKKSQISRFHHQLRRMQELVGEQNVVVVVLVVLLLLFLLLPFFREWRRETRESPTLVDDLGTWEFPTSSCRCRRSCSSSSLSTFSRKTGEPRAALGLPFVLPWS